MLTAFCWGQVMQGEEKWEATPIISFQYPGMFSATKIHLTLMGLAEAALSFVPVIISVYFRAEEDINFV